MAATVPQAAALGFKFVSVGEARGSLEVPWREDLVGDPHTGVIAGGVVTSLLDHTCGLAIASAAASIGGPFGTATLDLRIDYMRPAAPRAGVTAEAHCYKLTRSIAFVRAQAWDADPSDPIATAQAAFVLNRPQP
ncbi:MAG TPA: PaaI family thioesterase [Phenylobacterium sp.]